MAGSSRCCWSSTSSPAADSRCARLRSRLAELLDDVLATSEHRDLAGIAVGAVRGDETELRVAGLADEARRIDVRTGSVFAIASVTKLITALAVMQLVERGLLRLDDPAREHLRAFPLREREPERDPIRLAHLLSHTSGIGELRGIGDLLRTGFGTRLPRNTATATPAGTFGAGLRAELAPGRKWAYSNDGFAALGQIVEDTSGVGFRDYLVEHVFDALGMAHTDLGVSDRVAEQRVRSYVWRGDAWSDVTARASRPFGSGGVLSSLPDLLVLARALLDGGGRLVAPSTLAAMTESRFQLHPRLPAMGLGFWLENLGRHKIVYHAGAFPGCEAAFLLVPEQALGVVALSNHSGGAGRVAAALLDRALERRSAKVALPPATAQAELRGSYRPARGPNTNARFWYAFGGELEVYVDGRELRMRSPWGAFRRSATLHADPDDPLVFHVLDERAAELSLGPLLLAFRRNDAGRHGLALGFYALSQRGLFGLRRRVIGAAVLALAGASLLVATC